MGSDQRTNGSVVLLLNRWGHLLLRTDRGSDAPEEAPWVLPGRLASEGEAADECALGAFDEQAGYLLDSLTLFEVFRGGDGEEIHVYFDDPDIDIAELDPGSGEFAYVAPDELDRLTIGGTQRAIIERFLESSAYRALFH
jgi:hypothetical protein